MAYFPLFVNMEGKKVLIVGGGKIATRRLGVLLEFGAVITVVAEKLSKEIRCLEQEKRIKVFCRGFLKEDIKEQEIVLSATDDRQVEALVYQVSKEAGILVNLASDRTKCDFYFPAVVRSRDMVIGLTSGGSDHHAVKSMAGKLRDFFGDKPVR